jgi:hypothetical protein
MYQPLNYVTVNIDFLEFLYNKAASGESVVLIGSKYSGKKRVLTEVKYRLDKENIPAVYLELSGKTITSEEELIHQIIEAFPSSLIKSEFDPDNEDMENLLSIFDMFYKQYNVPIIFLCANVDNMIDQLARQLLMEVRTRVGEKQLVVILTGQQDLSRLTYGPNSEFNCANMFVVQKYGKDLFKIVFKEYSSALNINFDDPVAAFENLYTKTNGNIYLLRILLFTIIIDRLNEKDSNNKYDKYDIPNRLNDPHRPFPLGIDYLNNAKDLISQEPGCWSVLESLMENGSYTLDGHSNAPHVLELANVAIRQNGTLKFSSEFFENYIKAHYNDLLLGDLYASAGLMEDAFRHYEKIPINLRARPIDNNDIANLKMVVHAIGNNFYFAAEKGIDSLKHLVVQTLKNIFGFKDAFFVEHKKGWPEERDILLELVKKKIDMIYNEYPTESPDGRIDNLTLPFKANGLCLAQALPGIEANKPSFLVFREFEQRTKMSRRREILIFSLLDQFIKVYSKTIDTLRAKKRLLNREQHLKIFQSIVESLWREVFDVSQVIKLATQGLKELGYWRVLFCLVDPKRELIKGIYEETDEKIFNVVRRTSYLLENATEDIQPYVISTKKSIIVVNAKEHPLTNKDVTIPADMISIAIIPILDPMGEAIGTIHIEKVDKSVPSKEEVQDLENFGKQLAVAIDQAERITMLQTVLDKMPAPIVIADASERIRYLNKPSSSLLNLEVGWRNFSEGEKLNTLSVSQFTKCLCLSLEHGIRIVEKYSGKINNEDLVGHMLTGNILNLDNETLGAFLHIENLTILHNVLRAFEIIAEAKDEPSAIDQLSDAFQLMGHSWGRLYVLKDESDVLVSENGFGFSSEAQKKQFLNGKFTLKKNCLKDKDNWLVFEEKKPLVYVMDQECALPILKFKKLGQ